MCFKYEDSFSKNNDEYIETKKKKNFFIQTNTF